MNLLCMDVFELHSASPWLSAQPFRKDGCLLVLGPIFKLKLVITEKNPH